MADVVAYAPCKPDNVLQDIPEDSGPKSYILIQFLSRKQRRNQRNMVIVYANHYLASLSAIYYARGWLLISLQCLRIRIAISRILRTISFSWCASIAFAFVDGMRSVASKVGALQLNRLDVDIFTSIV
jgi:hypothetical protein